MKITNIEGSNGVIGSCCVVHFLSVDSKSAEFDKIIKLGPAKIDEKEEESKYHVVVIIYLVVESEIETRTIGMTGMSPCRPTSALTKKRDGCHVGQAYLPSKWRSTRGGSGGEQM